MNLEGKRVIITGGSSGIGLATAQAMIAVGAKVFITGRRPDILAKAVDQLRATRTEASGVAADVATNDGRATTLKAGLEKLGGLDILVNNAGGVRAGRLEDTSEAEIRAMIEVDLVAPILLTRAALRHLRASGDGLVVNVTSGIALIGCALLCDLRGREGGVRPFRRSVAPRTEGRGRSCSDCVSRRNRYPDDEIKPSWPRTRFRPGAGVCGR